MANKRTALEKILTLDLLHTLAGSATYERGTNYCESGKVVNFIRNAELLTANVAGARLYEAQLWVRAGRLQYTCDCPAAAEGAFCKHLVAVGLSWLNSAATG